jgi:iron complex transport system substrate-binding protein
MKRRQQGILTGMPFMTNIASRTFVDDLGRKLYLPHPPHRMVSLAPHITEMLFALGAGDHVIAVTRSCDYPPEAAHKPRIGETNFDPDALIALKSDLVLAPRTVADPALIDKVEQAKTSLYVMEVKTVEDVLSHLQTIGRMLARAQAATKLVNDMRRRIQQVKERTVTLPHPRLLFVLDRRPLTTVGPGQFIHQLIEFAGAQNIGAVMREPYEAISMEEVRDQDPDVLLFPVDDSKRIPEEELREWLRLEGLDNVGAKTVYTIDSALITRPGPRIVEGLERLVAWLHPDAFGELVPADS